MVTHSWSLHHSIVWNLVSMTEECVECVECMEWSRWVLPCLSDSHSLQTASLAPSPFFAAATVVTTQGLPVLTCTCTWQHCLRMNAFARMPCCQVVQLNITVSDNWYVNMGNVILCGKVWPRSVTPMHMRVTYAGMLRYDYLWLLVHKSPIGKEVDTGAELWSDYLKLKFLIHIHRTWFSQFLVVIPRYQYSRL